MDFTFEKYQELLTALKNSGMTFTLRHDVDARPQNSLATAKQEATLGLKAIYYFRAVPQSWDDNIIKEIAALGHEIGYHYECLTTCQGDIDAAWQDFQQNLTKLRQLASVHCICMHGSPHSKWDSRDMWERYDYRSQGITGCETPKIAAEPYLDTDWSQTFYLTDTGRCWDGYHVSVRDRIPQYHDLWMKQGLHFHYTDDIIKALSDKDSPLQQTGYHLLINTHPQRWNPFGIEWIKEAVWQNIKNHIKRGLITIRSHQKT